MDQDNLHWYAVKTLREFEAENSFSAICEDTYLPIERLRDKTGRVVRIKPLIPKLLFIKTTAQEALRLEHDSRERLHRLVPFWIYRGEVGACPKPIPEKEMHLMRLLTADESARCEVYRKTGFRNGDRVRVKAGPFEGYEGYIRRIRNNRHVVVEIEGLCAIALPFIHPDLLELIENPK